jgi:hypothetical protein
MIKFIIAVAVCIALASSCAMAKDDITNKLTNNNNMENNNDIDINNSSDSTLNNSTDVSNSITYDVSSASAASVFSNGCSTGASVQGIKGGFSIGSVNVICRNLMMADAYLNLARYAENKEVKSAYMGIAVTYLEDAGYVVKKTSTTGFIAQVTSDLSIPLAALLILLIL